MGTDMMDGISKGRESLLECPVRLQCMQYGFCFSCTF
jgi:hypothetical protein